MSKASFKRMMQKRAAALRPHVSPLPAPRAAVATPAYQRPTDEQLANFVSMAVSEAAYKDGLRIGLTPLMAGLMLAAHPEAKRGWLQRHREFQQQAAQG